MKTKLHIAIQVIVNVIPFIGNLRTEGNIVNTLHDQTHVKMKR